LRTCPGRQSKRLKNYDYRSYGAYFITTCVSDRRCLFGAIENGSIQLSTIGPLVQQCWLDIPGHHPFAALDEYIVMPNHFHGIAWLSIQALQTAAIKANTTPAAGFLKDSLSAVVASFKSAVTRTCNRLRDKPGRSFWQRSFYDHVIRDDAELRVIRQYIIDNPTKWQLDKENPSRTGVNPFYAWLESRALQERADS